MHYLTRSHSAIALVAQVQHAPRIFFVAGTLALLGCGTGPTIPTGPYEPTFESLEEHEVPEWFRNAKFGIFVHWGAYSVPAYGDTDAFVEAAAYSEWYWFLQLVGFGDVRAHHEEVYGRDVVYDDFLRQWNAEAFDAEEYAELFVAAGARYTVLVTKHHDGIALFSTRTTDRSTTEYGPRRDLVREFVDATREAGLRVGLYYSLLEWFHPDYEGLARIVPGLAFPYPALTNPYTEEPVEYLGYTPIDDFVGDHHLPQVRELVDQYDPDLMWLDGHWDQPIEYWRSLEAISYFYNRHGRSDELIVNDRLGTEIPEGAWRGDYRSFEYRLADSIEQDYFESTRGMGGSFGYNQEETLDDYLTTKEVLETLVDTVSKNGNLLLNVGPMASGEIPEVQRQILLGTGAWLEVNGEAIYGTRPWRTAGTDGVRFTRNGRTLYVHLFEQPMLDAPTPLSDAVPADPVATRLVGCNDTNVSVEAGGDALTLSGVECGFDVWVVALEYDHDL